eukprot:5258039-Amphidinium_carterae.1
MPSEHAQHWHTQSQYAQTKKSSGTNIAGPKLVCAAKQLKVLAVEISKGAQKVAGDEVAAYQRREGGGDFQ